MTDKAPDDTPSDLNLATHRLTESVWDRGGWNGTPEPLAISRMLVGVAGGVLALQGLRRRSWTGGAFAGLGSSLAWWALAGEGDLSEVRRLISRAMARFTSAAEDHVHEASAESFPASDAPARTPTIGSGLRPRVLRS